MSGEAALVLAAGQGTRMRSTLPKVLHPLAGRPMLLRVLRALDGAGFACPTVVVGYGADRITEVAGDRCRLVEQGEQRGTGDAARVGLASLPPSTERVLLVHGDEPLIPASVYRQMLDCATRSGAPIVLLTTEADDVRGFGRVIRNESGAVVALRQEGDLSEAQHGIREVNLGAYVFDAQFLRERLPRLAPHAPKEEYYLTDVVQMATEEGAPIEAVGVAGGEAIMGINDLVQLERATHAVYQATNRRLMESGVTIVDSASTFVDDEVEVAADTVIHPFTIISGATTIGRDCRIGPGTTIRDARIGEGCQVVSSTVMEASLDRDVRVGPYAHLRPGTRVGAGSVIGTAAEINRSTVGPGSRMQHFSYLGDAQVGANVNIGAGTITCNFDGVAKHRTVIEDGAFIGSDTMLRAPVTIGKGAATGAGTVVIEDVAPGSLVAGVPARVLREAPRSGEPADEETDRSPK